MSTAAPARPAGRRFRSTVLTVLAVVSTTLVGIVVARALARPSTADGVVSTALTVFAVEHPAVGNLDPDLHRALRRAATAADRSGVPILVKSGWRSSQYQEQLFDDAILKYGSAQRASRWVAPEDASRHLSGNAVDIGPSTALAWLSKHGAAYGLCRIYKNEPWHYELRPSAAARGCPPMYPTPAHDPRMQR